MRCSWKGSSRRQKREIKEKNQSNEVLWVSGLHASRSSWWSPPEDSCAGGAVDEDGTSGMSLAGDSCCRSVPARPKMLAVKITSPALASGKRVINSRWGLCRGLRRGLRRGLGSGLVSIITGTLEELVGGSSPVEVLALLAVLSAKVSSSLQKQD